MVNKLQGIMGLHKTLELTAANSTDPDDWLLVHAAQNKINEQHRKLRLSVLC
jgi:hypothetical protein